MAVQEDIEGIIFFPGSMYSRFIAGELVGSATFFGDTPTEIGQSVGWSQTPEPSTLCLLGFGLLGIATLRRKVANPCSTTPR